MNITETWFRNINEQKTNLSVFLDLKKPLIPSTMMFCCQNYEPMESPILHTVGSLHTLPGESNIVMLKVNRQTSI